MESGTDKYEWSILQNLEYQNRDVNNLKFSIIEKYNYAIAQVPNESGVGAFYIMLNPKAPPFYKQMPSKQYSLSDERFSVIQSHPKTITTVEMAVRSHVAE
ncbi:hypothetical protein FIU95_07815 [Microbulbifer sp. THAF38]|nr:hypothetical protein FIU95_07815 [Microbulbifer sp. THAF38]